MGGVVSGGVDNDELVDKLKGADYIKTPSVEKVFRLVDRGFYLTKENQNVVYSDNAWRRGNLHISAPCIYAQVMEGLQLGPGMSFLNLGSGTGYLSTMAGLLLGSEGVNHGVEIYSDVVEYAKERLAWFIHNSGAVDVCIFCEPTFVQGNALCLNEDIMMYDRVYCGASCPTSHENYMKNLLKVNGVLVMPRNDQLLKITRISKTEWSADTLLPVSFSSLIMPDRSFNLTSVKLPEVGITSLQELTRHVIRTELRTLVEKENESLKDSFIHAIPVNPRRGQSEYCRVRRIFPDITFSDPDDDSDMEGLGEDRDTLFVAPRQTANQLTAFLDLARSLAMHRNLSEESPDAAPNTRDDATEDDQKDSEAREDPIKEESDEEMDTNNGGKNDEKSTTVFKTVKEMFFPSFSEMEREENNENDLYTEGKIEMSQNENNETSNKEHDGISLKDNDGISLKENDGISLKENDGISLKENDGISQKENYGIYDKEENNQISENVVHEMTEIGKQNEAGDEEIKNNETDKEENNKISEKIKKENGISRQGNIEIKISAIDENNEISKENEISENTTKSSLVIDLSEENNENESDDEERIHRIRYEDMEVDDNMVDAWIEGRLHSLQDWSCLCKEEKDNKRKNPSNGQNQSKESDEPIAEATEDVENNDHCDTICSGKCSKSSKDICIHCEKCISKKAGNHENNAPGGSKREKFDSGIGEDIDNPTGLKNPEEEDIGGGLSLSSSTSSAFSCSFPSSSSDSNSSEEDSSAENFPQSPKRLHFGGAGNTETTNGCSKKWKVRQAKRKMSHKKAPRRLRREKKENDPVQKYSTLMKEKIIQLPIPNPLKIYLNYCRPL